MHGIVAVLGMALPALVILLALGFVLLSSIHSIGATEVGVVTKKFGRKLEGDDIIAFSGEAGYQAELLMPGWRFKFSLIYTVEKHPWVQVPANEIGVIIAQVGKALPAGAKSAIYKKEFGNFTDVAGFLKAGGQKGVQRPVLPPNSVLPLHPVAFLVLTKNQVFGMPVAEVAGRNKGMSLANFNLRPEQLDVFRIDPEEVNRGKRLDVVGVVTTLEGKSLAAGQIASRLGGFMDIADLEQNHAVTDNALMEALFNDSNARHNNFQDFQAFIDAGGEMGLQHDVLRYGAYLLNPFLVAVEIVPMLVVNQGETATIKAYEGLSTQDTSGSDFKFGSLVRPGHRGLWREALRTGKYALNPRIYQAEIVPTSIIKLDWAENVSGAHGLDSHLQPIVAKSNDGFVFKIDLQVLIHIPDTRASRVISMVGTTANLVNEVLQAAVGNHFRDTIGSMPAIDFIQTRKSVQEGAFANIKAQLDGYDVEVRGVYIQDVILPVELVQVLNQREIATQQIETYKQERAAQTARIEMEMERGKADAQRELAASEIGITIKDNNAKAREAEARGESTYISSTGAARAAEVRAVGLAKAEGYEKQVAVLGKDATAIVNSITALTGSQQSIMPQILVIGGGNNGGAIEGLAATLMGAIQARNSGGGNGAGSDKPADPSTIIVPGAPGSSAPALANTTSVTAAAAATLEVERTTHRDRGDRGHAPHAS